MFIMFINLGKTSQMLPLMDQTRTFFMTSWQGKQKAVEDAILNQDLNPKLKTAGVMRLTPTLD